MMESKSALFYKIKKEPRYCREVQQGERVIAYALLALTVLLKVAAAFLYRFDTDECQHLHIVWGWAHGFLQYRDVFDNHAPFFHMLCVPLLTAFGESANTLFAMRLAMVPLYCIVLWCTYVLGREVFSDRCGLWAAVFTGLWFYYFLCSAEYRPDDLWAVFWLVAIVILIKGGLQASRGFWMGVLMGAALGVSVKTTFLIASLGAAALAIIIFPATFNIARPAFNRLIKYGLALSAGISIIPGALIFFFYTQDALTPFFYQTIQHNMISGLGLWDSMYQQIFVFTVSLPLLFWIAWLIGRHTVQDAMRSRRIIIFLICWLYFSALIAFCPLMQPEHFFPFYPLFFILCTPFVWKFRFRPLPGWAVPALVILVEVYLICARGYFHGDDKLTMLKDVLLLTEATDSVADVKGETIFRPRSSYYVMEKITKTRFKRGLLTDDIPERLIAARTCVATDDDSRFPARARDFLNANYISVGSLRVAGKMLPAVSDAVNPIFFDIQIPAPYVIIAERKTVTGWLDGRPYDGGIAFLEAGYHEYRPAILNCRFAVLWAKAHKLGYSPFAHSDTM